MRTCLGISSVLSAVILLFQLSVNVVISDQADSEITDNTVVVRFYELSAQRWTDDVGSKIQNILVSEANRLCRSQYDLCGLHKWHPDFTFQKEHFSAGDIQWVDYSLEVHIHMKLNPAVARNFTYITHHILNKGALTKILEDTRVQIHDETEYAIIKIGGDKYHPPPATKVNQVMIPIAIAILLIILMIAVTLVIFQKTMENYWQRKKEGRDKKHRRVKSKTYPDDINELNNHDNHKRAKSAKSAKSEKPRKSAKSDKPRKSEKSDKHPLNHDQP